MRVMLLVAFVLLVAACGGRRGNLFVREGVKHVERYRETNDGEDRRRATLAFKKALAASPGTPGARIGLAVLSDNPKKARSLLNDEVDAHPELVAARFDRVLVYLATGKPEDAKKATADLGKLPSDDAEVQRLLVIARFMSGESNEVPPGFAGSSAHAAAVAAWNEVKTNPAADVAPEILAIAPRLNALVLARAGKWEDALAALPQTPDAALDRAITLAWLDRLDEARALVADALRRDPNDQRAQSLKGILD